MQLSQKDFFAFLTFSNVYFSYSIGQNIKIWSFIWWWISDLQNGPWDFVYIMSVRRYKQFCKAQCNYYCTKSFIINNTTMCMTLEKLKDRFEEPHFVYQSTKALIVYIYHLGEIKRNLIIYDISIITIFFISVAGCLKHVSINMLYCISGAHHR